MNDMKIEFNNVYYGMNCLDPDFGLPYLSKLVKEGEMEKIDLCLTDPPYNQKFKGIASYNDKMRKCKINYKDKMTPEKYKKFMYKWFDECKKICKGIIFTPGYSNRQIWFDKEEFEIVIWVNMYRQGASKIAKLNKFELILC